MDIIKEILALKTPHHYCDDSWYSCPLAEDGCCNDEVDKTKCNCGADAHNARVDALVKKLQPKPGVHFRIVEAPNGELIVEP